MECAKHTLVAHIAALHHSSALLVKYKLAPDGESGWFLPNDDLHHLEHPEEAAKRILREQVGIEDPTLKLAEIESFVGNNQTWHLIFDYLAFARTMKLSTGPMVAEAKWVEIEQMPPASDFAHHGWGRSVLVKHALSQVRPSTIGPGELPARR